MTRGSPLGVVYRCAVCGAEVTVIGSRVGAFAPRCCHRPMHALMRRAVFYRCPVCGAEIVVAHRGAGRFTPRCCNTDMVLKAA